MFPTLSAELISWPAKCQQQPGKKKVISQMYYMVIMGLIYQMCKTNLFINLPFARALTQELHKIFQNSLFSREKKFLSHKIYSVCVDFLCSSRLVKVSYIVHYQVIVVVPNRMSLGKKVVSWKASMWVTSGLLHKISIDTKILNCRLIARIIIKK